MTEAAGDVTADAAGESTAEAEANLNGILRGQGAGGGQATEATDTRRKLTRARNMYIRGDQVGGDKLILRVGGAEPAPLREVDIALSDPVRHAFVDPEDWERTRAAVHDRRLVLLRGGSGHGRVAAAIRLLQVPSDRPIYQLERDVDLHRFPHWLETDATAEKPLPIGAGFLLSDPTGKARLDGWVLHQIATALEQRDARMVLTLDVDLVLNDDDVRDFAVSLGRPRPHRDILASHLRWRLTERFDGEAAAAMTDRILADERVAEVIEEAFGDGIPVKIAANLALMIDQQFDGERVDVERLRRQLGERVVEDFDIWFGALPDVPSRSMAIALAVLNGLPYEHVARAARKLTDILDGPPQVVSDGTPMLQPPWRDPFTTSRREMLRMLRARTRQKTEFGNFGRTPIEVIEYIDRDRPRSVLDHVWHEYQFQRPILDWLRDLSTTPSLDVRTYVGTALGVLATYAFDFVHNHALREMALDDNPWSWDVVAYAMRIPAEDSRFYHPVRRMANRLHGNAQNGQAQATSARIRGHALAPIFLEPALIKLDALATVNDWRVAWGIGNSVADLLVEDDDRYGPVLLERIAQWQGDPRRTLCAQFVFQHVAQHVQWYVDVGKNGEQETEIWPGLLFLADRRPELRPMLVTCWVRLLNSSVMEPYASGALNDWADWADSYPDVLTAFIRLLKAVAATSPRTRAIVMRHAESWNWPDALFRLPDTTAAVTQALKARTEG
ncbi:hypothetical protein HH310_06760 [Actinoplanes sp. TBRC 11911]|uniref:hypothetical protein n=1 Tax=Actinoplanes sp. TBRC 11911 TaxID=2729386 RepID=UPI00145E1A83|nr:hypothetical protein [Actinoplanes sp. TBRC 11911]NMO50894.1 hypothetical protein [Actinoplanes sp. TBRC 11911]